MMDPEPPLSLQPSSSSNVLHGERDVVRKAGRDAIRGFLSSHTCFSVLRASGKVVVFDTRIPIQLAFYALVEHDMLAAPLWEPSQCQFVGLLTVVDFIDILLDYQQSGMDVGRLATHSIGEILPPQSFLGADSACTLETACRQLLDTGRDFLPICFADDLRVLACLTFTNVLEHLVTHFREQRRLFDDSITDLGIGTYGDAVIDTTASSTLASALQLMQRHHLSALPVIDEERRVIGVYSRSDITFLTKATDAQDAVRNLDLPIRDVLAQQRPDVTTPDALRTCSPSHTLQAIFESFAQVRFNRLYVVDDEEHLLGVVSAKDLVEYFLMESN